MAEITKLQKAIDERLGWHGYGYIHLNVLEKIATPIPFLTRRKTKW